MNTYTVITQDMFSGHKEVHTVKADGFAISGRNKDTITFTSHNDDGDAAIALFSDVVRVIKNSSLEVA